MLRDKSYRITVENRKVIARLKRMPNISYYRYYDTNNIIISKNPIWVDFIGTKEAFKYKTLTTDLSSSKGKNKWGRRNKRKSYYNYYKQTNCRISDKKYFKKLIKEYLNGNY